MLEDSEKSLMYARNEMQGGDEGLALYYCRMVFFAAWSALEGWINYTGESFASTDGTLSEYEIAFLKEKRIQIGDSGTVEVTNTDAYESTLRKLVFICRRFGQRVNFKESQPDLWRELKNVEKIRHAIVHPKNRDTDLDLGVDAAEKCNKVIRDTIQVLQRSIYGL